MPEVNISEDRKVNAKTLTICAKCSDLCVATLLDTDDNELFSHDGYVPDFMPGNHYGDYVMLDIDLETGRVTNWKAPTAEQLEEWISSHA